MDHAALAIEAIDRVLAEPPVSIEEALRHAVARGRMSKDEAEECLEAYERTFINQEGAA